MTTIFQSLSSYGDYVRLNKTTRSHGLIQGIGSRYAYASLLSYIFTEVRSLPQVSHV